MSWSGSCITGVEADRMALLLSVVGRPEAEIRAALTGRSGVYKHEINAVLLKLHCMSSKAFNEGVRAFLDGKGGACPHSGGRAYEAYINWKEGYLTAELAVDIHGLDAVMASL